MLARLWTKPGIDPRLAGVAAHLLPSSTGDEKFSGSIYDPARLIICSEPVAPVWSTPSKGEATFRFTRAVRTHALWTVDTPGALCCCSLR